MTEILYTLEHTDIEWEMTWEDGRKEMMFEADKALALLLINEVIFINGTWWEKEWTDDQRKKIYIGVLCNDIFSWACAECEELPHDQIETVYRMFMADPKWGPAKWCAIQRNLQPQKPCIELMKRDGSWDETMEGLGKNNE